MVQYESLLLGGAMSEEQKQARLENLKKARAVRAKNLEGRPPKEKKKRVAKTMTEKDKDEQYLKRLENLKKARAVRAKNIAEKKGMSGKGQYNQDYVDESQINYAGSPLDMYYLASPKEMEREREERGEVGDERGEIGMGAKRRGRKPKVMEVEEDSEEEEMQGGRMRRGGNLYTGMSRPTEEQFKRGGKMKRGRKKMDIEELEGGAMENVNIPDAIKVLAVLASKFGLKLAK